ncbi:hypothetical protein LTR85_009936 [Meristemomyces frigidus]|nr:hypothetical protein LTR85_009936 [Meristemomyces frigidus]
MDGPESQKAHDGLLADAEFSTDLRFLTIVGLPFGTIRSVVQQESAAGANQNLPPEEVLAFCLRSEDLAASAAAAGLTPTGPYTTLDRAVPVWQVLLADRIEARETTVALYMLFVLIARASRAVSAAHVSSQPPDGSSSVLNDRPAVLAQSTRIEHILPLLVHLAAAVQDRSFFVTEHGFLGMGHSALQPGDEVVVAFGCGTPLVLRREADHHVLVGPCDVLAIMNGEWVRACRSQNPDGAFSARQYCLH